MHRGTAERIDVGSQSRATGERRLVSIDAARGVAMLLVCLSHFSMMYWREAEGSAASISIWLTAVAMIATPTFLLISGTMLGFFHHTKGSDFTRVRVSLVDRGLFMLTVGHVLITVAHIPRMPQGGWSHFIFVTDAIAFSIILGPVFIGALAARHRLILGGAMYALSWVITLAWSPDALFLQRLKDALVGSYQADASTFSFPMLPWFGVYLVGSALGERLGQLYVAGDERRFGRLAMKVGGAAVLVGGALKLAYWGLKPDLLAFADGPLHLIYSLTSPWQKHPPGPVYVLLCGGTGLLMLSLIWSAERTGRFTRLLRLTSLWGRTSLFIFVLQYYVYYVVFFYWRPEPSPWWPLHFVASLAVMTVAARAWSIRGYNRYLTLGLGRLAWDDVDGRTGRWHPGDVMGAPAAAEK